MFKITHLFRVTYNSGGYSGQKTRTYTSAGHVKTAIKGFVRGTRVLKLEVAPVGEFETVDVSETLGEDYV